MEFLIRYHTFLGQPLTTTSLSRSAFENTIVPLARLVLCELDSILFFILSAFQQRLTPSCSFPRPNPHLCSWLLELHFSNSTCPHTHGVAILTA